VKKLLGFLRENSILVVAMVGIVAPWLSRNPYYSAILMMCVMFSVLASSLNIAVGLAGLYNLSHATFFGVGAYVAAILNTRFHVPFYFTIIAGGLVAAVFGAILGVPTLRLRGVFLALVTFAFGVAMRVLEINWISLTNGPMGIPGIGGAVVGGWKFNGTAYIYYGLALLLLCMYVTKRILKSKIGRALSALKCDEVVAKSMGVNVTFYKVGAYVLSACLAGMAGTIYAHYATFISPDTFTAADSTTVLCMVILGGADSLAGPVLGAVILTVVPEILRFAQLYRVILIGTVMVTVVIARERNWQNTISINLRRIFSFSKTRTDEDARNGGAV
jgi:branched-chain amino acid transport system permease protein